MSTIFEKDGRRILFVHIPKSAGTSVRNMLQDEGWRELPNPIVPPSVIFSKELNGPKDSNHQHEKLRRGWIASWDYEFALVRNPYDRILSRAKQQARDLGLEEIKEVNFFAWVDDILQRVLPEEGPGAEDNHYRPQHHFLSSNTKVFRLEDQKEDFLKELKAQKIISDKASLGIFNQSLSENKNYNFCWKRQSLIHSDFIKLYKEDFDILGYRIAE
tara:strand:- start:372 stop:1019 length:648 start_codon:yes stop_codon:yes gene_type:complete